LPAVSTTPTGGSVHVEGVELGALSRTELAALRRRSIGYVFQDLNLIPALTAVENVALPRELDGVRARTARREALAALAEVGVNDLADRFPDEMSGGQQLSTARGTAASRTSPSCRPVQTPTPCGRRSPSRGSRSCRETRCSIQSSMGRS
jgi:ABC-type lipoprotein export system ATPase subunit